MTDKKKFVIFGLLLLILAMGIPSCIGGGLQDGNLIGTVVREGSGVPVPFPVLIIGRVMHSPTVPDQQITGDKDGKFDITLNGGNYTIQISSGANGPFYVWPNPVFITEYQTSVALFTLPVGF